MVNMFMVSATAAANQQALPRHNDRGGNRDHGETREPARGAPGRDGQANQEGAKQQTTGIGRVVGGEDGGMRFTLAPPTRAVAHQRQQRERWHENACRATRDAGQ